MWRLDPFRTCAHPHMLLFEPPDFMMIDWTMIDDDPPSQPSHMRKLLAEYKVVPTHVGARIRARGADQADDLPTGPLDMVLHVSYLFAVYMLHFKNRWRPADELKILGPLQILASWSNPRGMQAGQHLYRHLSRVSRSGLRHDLHLTNPTR